MLNADLYLKNEAESKRAKSKQGKVEGEDESGFHFIAFVPIQDQVWKLDGLERQPQILGIYLPPSLISTSANTFLPQVT